MGKRSVTRPSKIESLIKCLVVHRDRAGHRWVGEEVRRRLDEIAANQHELQRATLRPHLLAIVLALVGEQRDRSVHEYDARLEQWAAIARLLETTAAGLGQLAPVSARARGGIVDALVASLELPVHGSCTPQCCGAASTYHAQMTARTQVLHTLGRIDSEAGTKLPREVVTGLLTHAPLHQAMLTIELLMRSPEACRVHLAALREGLDGRHWQVAELCVRALSRPEIEDVESILPLLRHPRWQVRRAVVRGLRTRAGRAKIAKRLTKVARSDPHATVRWQANKTLDPKFPGPPLRST